MSATLVTNVKNHSCSEAKCTSHRARCQFGRPHVWSTWYANGQLVRTADTYHCHNCGGVCIGDEA